MKMKIIPLLAAFVLTLFSMPVSGQESNGVKAPEKVKKKEDFHLYLLIGGSNMLVKNTFKDNDSKSYPSIFLFDDGNKWISAENHVKSCEGKEVQGEGTGPSIHFAEAMLSRTKDKDIMIGLINCAQEDSGLPDWMKGGKYYAKAVERAKLAMETGILKGILWHQASAEMKKADPSAYANDIGKIAVDLRKDLNSPSFHPTPFVWGKLVSYPYELDKDKDQFKVLNDTLQKTFNDIDRSGLVESKGLKDSGDGIRFDAESMNEFGKRYADAMIYLEGKQPAKVRKNLENKKIFDNKGR
ncbi:MAG: sialate O-acetylesterase [Victivallales bacterium]|jgi:hypothetical protein